jgi:cytochrome c oxidase subunit II
MICQWFSFGKVMASQGGYMERRLIFGLALLLALFSLAAGSTATLIYAQAKKVGDSAPADAPVKEIEIQAKKYEFSPSSIEVPSNTLVKIHLTALDREHGFELRAYPGSCVKFKPGEPAIVEFYSGKSGEFEFSCCKYCGLGHGKMKGTLIVRQP